MTEWEYMGNGKCVRDADALQLTKLRDADSGLVQLKVTISNPTSADSTVLCSFLNLDADLKQIGAYGIYFDASDKYKIKNIIKEKYTDIPNVAASSREDEIAGLFEMFCASISVYIENNDKSTVIEKGDWYCMPIDKFDAELKGSITKMNAKDLRKAFADKNYTVYDKMRTDKVVKNHENVTVRCVAFIKEQVEKINGQSTLKVPKLGAENV